ncbi:hypothetical protein CEXT_149441 [Caerostris extrusa]|uniref:Uncharacterized protein n=1 Tax=Caerostris extrusa TaxID=172846 RepID=A0AAV4XPW0_CAEEX|nr:hypothetical protein CEXT_149441 [Caerostris extrusa]
MTPIRFPLPRPYKRRCLSPLPFNHFRPESCKQIMLFDGYGPDIWLKIPKTRVFFKRYSTPTIASECRAVELETTPSDCGRPTPAFKDSRLVEPHVSRLW